MIKTLPGYLCFPALLTVLFLLPAGCSPKPVWDSGLEVGAVATSNEHATEVGQKILEGGGNAVDAAIAVSFALHVAEPYGSGIGGSGSMLIFPADGKPAYIDYRDKAPAEAAPDMFTRASKSKGGLSVSVPGQLRGMEKAYELYGSKKFTIADLLEPAIELAEDGVIVTGVLSDAIGQRIVQFRDVEILRETYLVDGFYLQEGQTMKQPHLAKTLAHLAENGFDSFYEGEIAEAIIETVRMYGGIMTAEDLASYGEARVSSPLKGEFGPYTLYSAPLPNCGGINLVQLLNIWERYPGEKHEQPDALEAAYLAHTMNTIYRDRNKLLGDPSFIEVDVDDLLSEKYFDEATSQILDEEMSAETIPDTGGSTTSFVTADSEGNVVVVTQSIHSFFGSGLVVPEWGIFLNNGMNNFSDDPNSPNAPDGGKIPVSPMTPSIFVKDNEPVLAIGSPGGMRIVSAIGQVSLNYLERGQTLKKAIDAPRFHYQGGEAIQMEMYFPNSVYEGLEEQGFKLHYAGIGSVTALGWYKETPEGCADERRGGGVFIK